MTVTENNAGTSNVMEWTNHVLSDDSDCDKKVGTSNVMKWTNHVLSDDSDCEKLET